MASLIDYKVDGDYLKQFGLVSDGEDSGEEASIINLAWEHLLTRIFDINDITMEMTGYDEDVTIKTKAMLYAYLTDDTNSDSEDKIDGFKFAQYKVIEALINSEANPITAEVDAVLSSRCGLVKRNGYQKN